MGAMPYAFSLKADPGDNKAIGREQAFNSTDAQIEVYPAVSSGAYYIIRSEMHQRNTILKPLHQVGIYFVSYFFVLVHIVVAV